MLRVAFTLAACIAIAGCGAVPIPSLPPTPSAQADPDIPHELAHAMDFRRELGLRSDRAWVEQVALDPLARIDVLDIPLMPFEEAELNARAVDVEEIAPIVSEYGAAHPPEYGGVYIDQPGGGIVTALFTANLPAHEAALRARVRPGAPLAVRQIRFPEAALVDLQERIARNSAWFATIPAVLSHTGLDTIDNVVLVGVSSAHPQADEIIVAHFGAAGMLRVTSDGTGVRLKPPGELVGRVIDRDGRPIVGAPVAETPLFDAGPRAGVGHLTSPDGTFNLGRLPPGRWRVSVMQEGVVLGSAEVDVPPGGRGVVEIVLDRPLPSP